MKPLKTLSHNYDSDLHSNGPNLLAGLLNFDRSGINLSNQTAERLEASFFLLR